MNEPKPFASLGPTLLARKGGARPAMRPQLGALAPTLQPIHSAEPDLDDLGWNDMGHPEDEPSAPPPVVSLVPSHVDEQPAEPEGRSRQREVAKKVAPEPSRPPQVQPSEVRRAAFTLRLDARRHLMLRLASTVRNRSAQALVTEALDRFLADVPEIDALAAHLHRD